MGIFCAFFSLFEICCTSWGLSLTQGFIKDILAHGSVGFLLTDSTFLHPKRRLLARRLVLDFPFCFGYLGFWGYVMQVAIDNKLDIKLIKTEFLV